MEEKFFFKILPLDLSSPVALPPQQFLAPRILIYCRRPAVNIPALAFEPSHLAVPGVAQECHPLPPPAHHFCHNRPFASPWVSSSTP